MFYYKLSTKLAASLLCFAAETLLGTGQATAQTPTVFQAAAPPANSLWLDSLDLSQMTAGYGTPTAGKSIGGGQITLDGDVYPHGVGTHAKSEFDINLKGVATRFSAVVGVDDEEKGKGSVTFKLIVDGKDAALTPVLHGDGDHQLLSVNLTGAHLLRLKVGDGDDGISCDHADWAGAYLTLLPNAAVNPVATPIQSDPQDAPRMTFPPVNPAPAIQGARIIGASPGHPFLFLIPATGSAPLKFFARNLPAGLTLDGSTGLITGAIEKPGTTIATLTVVNSLGAATKPLKIVCGEHEIALTPPMGWCSWDAYSGGVNAGNVKATADAMVSSGLISHGYTYINLDDTWEAGRDASGYIQTNSKFPDMPGLISYLHSLGLKFGIYSSPGPSTCGGYTGSYGHEAQDAQSYARWGVDYVKHDYCTYSKIAQGDTSVPTVEKPYALMGAALQGTDRDMVFGFCEYGLDDPWVWGPAAGGNLWRINQDLTDDWYDPQGGAGWTPGSLKVLIDEMADTDKYVTPGHWNDPDQIPVGYFDWGSSRPVHFTKNEQILLFSMWSMSASPLIIGSDITRLDPFTTSLLTNDEVIAVDQDPLARAAERVEQNDNLSVWCRPLADGTRAVALVNASDDENTVTVRWSDLGLAESQPVRDLWLHKDLGIIIGSYSVEVPTHGCVLLKVGRPH